MSHKQIVEIVGISPASIYHNGKLRGKTPGANTQLWQPGARMTITNRDYTLMAMVPTLKAPWVCVYLLLGPECALSWIVGKGYHQNLKATSGHINFEEMSQSRENGNFHWHICINQSRRSLADKQALCWPHDLSSTWYIHVSILINLIGV